MKCHSLALALVMTLVGQASAVAETEKEARAAIQSQYNAFDKAYMLKDHKKVREFFTPECAFYLGGEGRSMKASKALTTMEALSKSMTISKAKTKVESIKAKGQDFEVVAVWSGHSKYVPLRQASEDPPREADAKQAYRDLWRKTDKGWKIANRVIGEDADDVKSQELPKKPAQTQK